MKFSNHFIKMLFASYSLSAFSAFIFIVFTIITVIMCAYNGMDQEIVWNVSPLPWT